jgi:GNAT superfamily N-acetyltransferase
MKLTIRPLTTPLLPALEDLFADSPICRRCWCMYWRIGAAYQRAGSARNRAAFRAVVRRGPPPGLLAFDGDTAVGWCQLTPRERLPHLERSRRLRRVDDLPVWSISCFYVRKSHRRRGVTSTLIAEALKVAKRAGAPALEAYPLDRGLSPSAIFTGVASTFERAGFETVARHVPARPIMRHALAVRGRAEPNKRRRARP